MAVQIVYGDLFESDAELLVNPTNCQGLPGALAGVFAERFRASSAEYREDCLRHDPMALRPLGNIMIFQDNWPDGTPQAIAFFTTVKTPGGTSDYSTIERGLSELHRMAKLCSYDSIALPALGCGIGGLEFEQVKQLVCAEFDNSEVIVLLYSPIDNNLPVNQRQLDGKIVRKEVRHG